MGGTLLLPLGAEGALHAQTAPAHLSLQDLLSAEPVNESVLSPDGKTHALVRKEQVTLLSADGGWPITLTSTPGGKSGLAWSPDGKRLAFVNQGSVWTVPVDGGGPTRLTNAPAGTGDPRHAADRNPRWSPDGRWILFASGRRGGSTLLVVIADGNTTSFLSAAQEEASEGRWSPDGKAIVYVSRPKEYFSGRINLLPFDAHSGQPAGSSAVLYTSPVDRGGGWSVHDVEWPSDGRTLVATLQNSGWDHLYLLSAKGGQPKQITDGSFDDGEPHFSPDGKTLAFVSNRRLPAGADLWTVPVRGGDAREVATFRTLGISSDVEWAPDGKSLFFHHQSANEATDLFTVAIAKPSEPGRSPRPLRPTLLVHSKCRNVSPGRAGMVVRSQACCTNRRRRKQARSRPQSSGFTAVPRDRTLSVSMDGHSFLRRRGTLCSNPTTAAAPAMARPYAT